MSSHISLSPPVVQEQKLSRWVARVLYQATCSSCDATDSVKVLMPISRLASPFITLHSSPNGRRAASKCSQLPDQFIAHYKYFDNDARMLALLTCHNISLCGWHRRASPHYCQRWCWCKLCQVAGMCVNNVGHHAERWIADMSTEGTHTRTVTTEQIAAKLVVLRTVEHVKYKGRGTDYSISRMWSIPASQVVTNCPYQKLTQMKLENDNILGTHPK